MSETRQVKIQEDVLLCPSCGGNNLHHTYVKIYERIHCEDGPSYACNINGIKDEKFNIFEYKNAKRNPSARRDGIRIGFWCECCDDHIELTIAQHKGLTLLEFDVWENGRISETLSGIYSD